MREGCKETATIVPVLKVPAEGWPINFHTPCQVIIGIETCTSHFDDMDVQELITVDMREAFTHVLRGVGKAKPDFNRAVLNQLLIDSDDYRQFVSRRKPDA